MFFSCIIFSYMFGALSAYLIIIGDVLTDVASRHIGEDSVYASYSFAVIVWGGALLLPLSLKRNFSDLAFVSFISIISFGYLLVAVCIRSHQGMADKGWHVLEGVNYFPRDFSSLMNAVPVIGFAFVCHLQICEIARELNPYSSFCGGGCCNCGTRGCHGSGRTRILSIHFVAQCPTKSGWRVSNACPSRTAAALLKSAVSSWTWYTKTEC